MCICSRHGGGRWAIGGVEGEEVRIASYPASQKGESYDVTAGSLLVAQLLALRHGSGFLRREGAPPVQEACVQSNASPLYKCMSAELCVASQWVDGVCDCKGGFEGRERAF